jgi:hypothetical protein
MMENGRSSPHYFSVPFVVVENPPGLDVVDTLNLPCKASRKTIVAQTGKRATAILVAKSRRLKQLLESFFTTLGWIDQSAEMHFTL